MINMMMMKHCKGEDNNDEKDDYGEPWLAQSLFAM